MVDTDSSDFELIEDEASEADRKGAVQDTSGDSKVVRFSVAKKSCLNSFPPKDVYTRPEL